MLQEYEEDPDLGHYEHQYDCITLMWHTFCELGDSLQEREFFDAAIDRLNPGGTIYLEIPDRDYEPYRSSLLHYHTTHADEPFGTIRDTTTTEAGKPSQVSDSGNPRFFPGKFELKVLLEQAGFINVQFDTYLITTVDNKGNSYLEVKELIVTAEKPKDSPKANRYGDWGNDDN